MNRMKLCLVAFCLLGLLTGSVYGDHENIPRVSSKTFFTNQALDVSTVVTSSDSMQSVAVSRDQSVQWANTSTGGTANFASCVLCSNDETTWYQPTVGGTVTTVTDDNGGIAPITVPVCKSFKLRLVNLSGTVTEVVSATVISQ